MRGLGGIFVFALVSSLGLAQDKGQDKPQDPPPAETAKQDHVDIPATIESWYEVIEDKDHAGWIHEQISNRDTSRLSKYDYIYESEYDHTFKTPVGEQNLHITEKFSCDLGPNFDIFHCDYSGDINGIKLSMTVSTFPEQDRRLMSVEFPDPNGGPNQKKDTEFTTADRIHLNKATLLYMLRQRGDLGQSRPLREKMAGMVEKERLVEITVKPMVDKIVLDKSSKVTPVQIPDKEMEPFPTLTQYWVDKYGRIVEAQSADGSFSIKLVKDSGLAKKESKGAFAPKSRRDPFTKTGTPRGPEGSRTGPDDKGKGTKEEVRPPPDVPKPLDEALTKAEDLVQQLRVQIGQGSTQLAGLTYQDILVFYERLYPLCQAPMERTRLQKIRQDSEKYYDGIGQLLRLARASFDRIQDFSSGDQVEGIDKELIILAELRKRREFYKPPDDSISIIDGLISKAGKLRGESQARIDLAKKTIILQGTVFQREEVITNAGVEVVIFGGYIKVSEPIRAYRQISFAVVNNESYQEGATLPDGVKIDKIYRHAIQISYKGQIREVPLKK